MMKPAVAQFDSLQRRLCYQHRMRLLTSIAVVALYVAGCGQNPGTPATSPAAPSSPPVHVQPANIAKVRSDLPAGYEVADIAGRAAPAARWGFGPGWTADPPQCTALADPVTDGAVTQFQTALSGELFELLRRHSVLARDSVGNPAKPCRRTPSRSD